MLKENFTPSDKAVVEALKQFTNDQLFIDDLKELPADMQDIVERLFETEHANQIEVRHKAMRCLNFMREFDKAMSPFSSEQIEVATHGYYV